MTSLDLAFDLFGIVFFYAVASAIPDIKMTDSWGLFLAKGGGVLACTFMVCAGVASVVLDLIHELKG